MPVREKSKRYVLIYPIIVRTMSLLTNKKDWSGPNKF